MLITYGDALPNVLLPPGSSIGEPWDFFSHHGSQKLFDRLQRREELFRDLYGKRLAKRGVGDRPGCSPNGEPQRMEGLELGKIIEGDVYAHGGTWCLRLYVGTVLGIGYPPGGYTVSSA